jgi:hypothetical protein
LASTEGHFIVYASAAKDRLGLGHVPAGLYDIDWLDIASGQTTLERAKATDGGEEFWLVPHGFGAEVAAWIRPSGQ